MPSPIVTVKNAAQSVIDFLSPFSKDYPITTQYGAATAAGPEKGKPHEAVDFGAPYGTPVLAMAKGVVVQPNDNPNHVTGGNTVTIDYGNGIKVLVAHLSEMNVKPGDIVSPGQIIGKVGNSGITTGHGGTSGAHLHLEAWKGSAHIDPLDLFDPLSDLNQQAADKPQFVGVQADGNCPVGYHRVDDGFFGLMGNQESYRCEADSLPGAVLAGGLDVGQAGVKLIAWFFDPMNWARMIALSAGSLLSLIGLYIVWQSTT